jgi:formylglycine-generating enzyme required for sulfatase activity
MGFAAGRHVITRGQYAAFMEATSHQIEPGAFIWNGTEWTFDLSRTWQDPGFSQDDTHPVVCVSWHDAWAYVMCRLPAVDRGGMGIYSPRWNQNTILVGKFYFN